MKNWIANDRVNSFGQVECYKLLGSFCFPGSHGPHTFVCVYGRKQKWNVRHFVCSAVLKPIDSFTLFLFIDSFCREMWKLWIRTRIPSWKHWGSFAHCTSKTSVTPTAPPICRGTFCTAASPTSRQVGHGMVTPCLRVALVWGASVLFRLLYKSNPTKKVI